MTGHLTSSELSAFDAAWQSRWLESRPVGSELRFWGRATWVRFHSLRGSKRYAENKAERDELLLRHLVVLEDLSSATAASASDLRFITSSWSTSPYPAKRTARLVSAFPAGVYWRTVPRDADDVENDVWRHLFVGAASLDGPEVCAPLLLVADEQASEVIVCPPSVDWLYHPYDGGGDVIAPDIATRDDLKVAHANWLSPHPGGV